MATLRKAPIPQTASTPSISHKINREVILILGWGRALLLQLAHPLVAQAVADHSEFDTRPGGHLRRFRYTLQAMLDLSFGSQEETLRAAGGINQIHDRVHGRLSEDAGPWDSGTRYSAHDPKLLAWVHVTLLDSLLKTYELYVGPLTEAEKDAYCREGASVEELLEMPPGVLPRSHRELGEHLRRVLSDGDIVVTKTSLRLAEERSSSGRIPAAALPLDASPTHPRPAAVLGPLRLRNRLIPKPAGLADRDRLSDPPHAPSGAGLSAPLAPRPPRLVSAPEGGRERHLPLTGSSRLASNPPPFPTQRGNRCSRAEFAAQDWTEYPAGKERRSQGDPTSRRSLSTSARIRGSESTSR